MKIEIKRIGNSEGLILPRELMRRLQLKHGQQLHITELPGGGFQALPYDPEFEKAMEVVDEIINITDRESFEMARQLSRREGIFCGGSSGTIFAGALKVAKDLTEDDLVVFIVCDTGEHYLTKFHSDEWMKEKLLLEPQKITAGLIAETKNGGGPKELIFASPDDLVKDALARMDENGVTQLPVLEE